MYYSKEKPHKPIILIIGSGIIGKFNALELTKFGYEILIADPLEMNNSSNAALGILMGRIYQKRKGRAWILREKSLKLWPKWIDFLKNYNPDLNIDKPLIQLTTNIDKFKKLQRFVIDNPEDQFEILEENSKILNMVNKIFKKNKFKGIISHEDGRINPHILLKTLNSYLEKQDVKFIKEKVTKIERKGKEWISYIDKERNIKSDLVLLCNSLDSLKLINHKEYGIRLKPVIGQAIEIFCDNKDINFLSLPKQFSINSKNLIPISENKILIGSTNEYNSYKASEAYINELTEFIKNKPKWLNKKQISKKWFGIRSRPEGEPSPILRSLEKGLILCTGFYKNGILLAPACAEWISNEVKKHI